MVRHLRDEQQEHRKDAVFPNAEAEVTGYKVEP